MKQNVEIVIEAHEVDALRRGRRLLMEIGGHAIGLRFAADAASANENGNGARARTTWQCPECGESFAVTSKGNHLKAHRQREERQLRKAARAATKAGIGRCPTCKRDVGAGAKHARNCGAHKRAIHARKERS